MSQNPLLVAEEAETLSSLTTTSSSSTCTTGSGATNECSMKTQIEISITTTTTELQIANDEESHLRESSVTPTPSSIKYEITIPKIEDVDSISDLEEKFRSFDEEIVNYTTEGPNTEEEDDDDDDEDEDDDTLSSEAMVDDIELILMPEETDDLPQVESPKLVRVRELMTDESGYPLEDDEDDDECNFRKMDVSERSDRRTLQTDEGSNEEEESMIGDMELEGAVGYTVPTFSEITCSGGRGNEGCCDEDEPSFASSTTSGRDPRGKYIMKSLASSGVQTDISALNTSPRQPIICGDYRLGSGGRKGMTSSSGKKLNWKSELTLLPSKTKVGHHYHGIGGGGLMSTAVSSGFHRDEDDRDQYSTGCRVAKFTSQDNVLSSSSQFLKPSTLYRTRNLSRNLNQLGSSETSFILPSTETLGFSSNSPRFRSEWTNLPSASGKGSTTNSGLNQRRPTTAANPFRSSLPDLSFGPGDTSSSAPKRRQSHQYSRHLRSSHSGGGQGAPFGSTGLRKCRKKSSSDEETSSLIDESERCLRSSIDLLLTDDIPPPGYDYPYCGTNSLSGLGRRYCSQPILTEDAFFYREPRNKGMGSPFLPRRMADMRCSKYAKVILPDGQVSVVSVLEIDEIRDTLKVLTDSGIPIVIPFRKVVFAWRSNRR